MTTHAQERRVIFFDLDGTLHRQDLLGSYLRWMLRRQPFNLLLVIPLLPVVIAGLLLCGRTTRWPMSLLLWAITFGHSEQQLIQREQQFVQEFRQRVTPFPVVQQRLAEYLNSDDTDVWLMTGSPQSLVEQVYADSTFLSRVNLVSSQMVYARGGRILTLRCLGQEKVVQLEKRLGAPLNLYSGYSDSDNDLPMIRHCQHRVRVTPDGKLQPWA